MNILLHHFGPDVSQSSLLGPLRDAGIDVEIKPLSATLSGDTLDTLAFLARHRPVAFLPQCLGAMCLAGAMAGRQGLPWVMTMHSDDPMYWAIAESTQPERSNGRIIGVSDYISSLVVRRGLARCSHTISYGVPNALSSTHFADAPFRVAYSGRLVEEQKRISLVIAAMIEACRRDPRIECLLFGGGSEEHAARGLVERANLKDRVLFRGRLDASEVQRELLSCQVCLLMSDFEGLPLSLLEAMSVGVVPVVRAIESGVPELVHDNLTGLLVDKRPETAASAIERLANDPILWTHCSQQARRLVEAHFSEESCYQKWVAVLEELCQSSARQTVVAQPNLLLSEVDPMLLRYYPQPLSLTRRLRERLGSAARKTKQLLSLAHG